VRELATMDDAALLQAIALMGGAFDIPGIDKTDIALQDLRGNRELWLSHGADQAVRNDPKQWQEGSKLLLDAGLMRATDRKLYTNDIWESAVA
jgi:NitT/TauT family transport system substrate-binding protein